MTSNPCGRSIRIADPSVPPADASPAIAGAIINIAGLVPGDRLLCRGAIGSAVEAAAIAAGARILAARTGARRRAWRPITAVHADVAFVSVNAPWAGVSEEIRRVRRCLRQGGRLVMWAVLDREPAASTIRGLFQRIVRPPMFTSTIVGRLRVDGHQVVAATAILRPQPPVR